MHAEIDTLASVVTRHGVIPCSSAGVVAVSGGRDSMVLLHALDQEKEGRGWRLVVAHYHHGLRGAAADDDEAFVAKAAGRYGLEFVSERGDVEAARVSGESWEMAARRLRHAFLARTARERGCGWVALGHHGGDQAELLLLRLLRGAGPDGLGGMKMSAPSPADPSVSLVRPMLPMESGAVEALAEAWGIAYRDDATNTDPTYRRNRVRHELMPYLRARFQPALERVLVREQVMLRDQADFVESLAREWLTERPRRGGRTFGELPPALQREVLRVQARALELPLDFEKLEGLRREPDVAIEVTAGRRCIRESTGSLREITADQVESRFCPDQLETVVGHGDVGGEVRFGGGFLRWDMVDAVEGLAVRSPGANPVGGGTGEERFDAEVVGRRVLLRHWQPGDRFAPIGLGAAAKLQDLFTAARVSPEDRRRRVVAQNADGAIFWVEGLRIGECAKVTEVTRRTLVWRWSRTESSCASGDGGGED